MFKTILSKNKFTAIKTRLRNYKTLLKLIWTYALKLWGVAKKKY